MSADFSFRDKRDTTGAIWIASEEEKMEKKKVGDIFGRSKMSREERVGLGKISTVLIKGRISDES